MKRRIFLLQIREWSQEARQ